MATTRPDRRIVYGANCVWWDSIDKVAAKPTPSGRGLPCCPHCGSVLMEVPSIEHWNRNMDRYEADGHPGYRAMMEWSRGKCFPTMTALRAAHEAGRGGQ
ncbi:MAG: hypothetical protein EPN98_21315 [Phenylobacterium sp.]|uniref:hypothetical protein n=1 Tax=Phenylobacterium sp. TaxID=1871053 RepID=UPI001200A972|nr:hypothetical protein [Phenylobacterium sp.]TAL28984.1 MAG: hypothetical protein EPN98_21315 [Phenylobacterium sp.]